MFDIVGLGGATQQTKPSGCMARDTNLLGAFIGYSTSVFSFTLPLASPAACVVNQLLGNTASGVPCDSACCSRRHAAQQWCFLHVLGSSGVLMQQVGRSSTAAAHE